MKKIVFVVLHLGYGGVEKAITEQANLLVEDYDVEILSVYKIADKPAFSLNNKIKVNYITDLKPNREEFSLKLRNKKYIGAFFEGIKSLVILYNKYFVTRRAIRKIEADVVIATRYFLSKFVGDYVSPKTLKIAQEHNDHKFNKKYLKKVLLSIKKMDYLMPSSNYLTEEYVDILKGKTTKCKYIPIPINFNVNKKAKLNTKKIVAIGRLEQEKGFFDMIDVMKKVVLEDKEIILNIVGDGSQYEELEKKIKKEKLNKNVFLKGYQQGENLEKIILNSDLYLMTSFEESFGIVLLEAALCGVPAIAFDSARGAQEIIKNGHNGYLIEERDFLQMSNQIINYFKNSKKRKSLAEKAYKNAEKYRNSNVKREWIEFLTKEIKTDERIH